MNARLILLLTRDGELLEHLNHATGGGTTVLRAQTITDAIQILCRRGSELDLAVIDFAEGCHGMTLLSALHTCRPSLPIVVTTSTDAYHASMLAYSQDVAACLAKPISADELAIVIHELEEPKLQLKTG